MRQSYQFKNLTKYLACCLLFFCMESFAYQEDLAISKNINGQTILVITGMAYNNCGEPVQGVTFINPIAKTFSIPNLSQIVLTQAPIIQYFFPAYNLGGPPCTPSVNLQTYRYELILPADITGVYTFDFKPRNEAKITKAMDLQTSWSVPIGGGLGLTVLIALVMLHRRLQITA